MTSSYYGHATRAVSSPIASGQRGRFSQPTKYLPLSQFFLQQGEAPDGKVIYGRKEPEKKKPKEKEPEARQEAVFQEEQHRSEDSYDFCDFGGGHFSAFLEKHPRYDTDEFREFAAAKNKGDRDSGELDDLAASEVERLARAYEEGMTTTANVPTVPVPIGVGDGRRFLDRPGDKKKKKKKDLADGVGLLLRRLF